MQNTLTHCLAEIRKEDKSERSPGHEAHFFLEAAPAPKISVNIARQNFSCQQADQQGAVASARREIIST